MMTVISPLAIVLGGPTASRTVSPIRQAGRLLISTVCEPSITTPGPCGGIGKGVAQEWMSAPPAELEIILPIDAAEAAFTDSSAAFAAGAPGVPAAARVAASATLMAVSEICLAACNAPPTAPPTPLQAGSDPISTFRLPGPGPKTGGSGCTTLSVTLAAGPVGITCPLSSSVNCALIKLDQRSLHIHQSVGSDVYICGCINLYAGLGIHFNSDGAHLQLAGLGGDRDIRDRLDRDGVVFRADNDLVVVGLVDDLDRLGAALVVESNDVSAA